MRRKDWGFGDFISGRVRTDLPRLRRRRRATPRRPGRWFEPGEMRLVILRLIREKPRTATRSSRRSRSSSTAAIRRPPAASTRRSSCSRTRVMSGSSRRAARRSTTSRPRARRSSTKPRPVLESSANASGKRSMVSRAAPWRRSTRRSRNLTKRVSRTRGVTVPTASARRRSPRSCAVQCGHRGAVTRQRADVKNRAR